MEAVLPSSSAGRAGVNERSVRIPSVWRDQAILSMLGFWMAIGLAIDTRRHRTDRSLDTFFTSAHGLLYAGWMACTVFTLYVVRRNRANGALTLRDAIPRGLEPAVGGCLVFGIGGIGDLIWHTRYGIERDFKILFSPTHLFLMTAMLMLTFGPVRVLWMSREDADARPTLSRFWPAALAAGSMASVLFVFFQYVSAFERPVFTSEIPALLNQLSVLIKALGVLSVLVATAIYFGTMLLLARRWLLPFGSFVVVAGVVCASMFIFTDFRRSRLLLAFLVGGLLCDVLRNVSSRLLPPRAAYRVLGGCGPLLWWGSYLAFTVPGNKIRLEPEIWTGAVVWSAVIGLGLTVLLLPPRLTPVTHLD
jgi:hypothetical protein